MKTKNLLKRILLVPALLLSLTLLQGCIVVKAVDTAADAAIGVTKTTVKTTGKVVGTAIPNSDKKEEKE